MQNLNEILEDDIHILDIAVPAIYNKELWDDISEDNIESSKIFNGNLNFK